MAMQQPPDDFIEWARYFFLVSLPIIAIAAVVLFVRYLLEFST